MSAPLLHWLTPAYATANAARMAMFDRGLRRPQPLGRPTISIGNLTTGGTGKTPMVAWVCRHLIDRGHRPAVLTRGYRGGDEARELQAQLGANALVHIHPKRVDGAAEALAQDPSISCFVLDDGFQHRQAARNLDLVLLSAGQPLDQAALLPAGRLREPLSALQRADAIVLTHCPEDEPALAEALRSSVRAIPGAPAPLAVCDHQWSHLLDAQGQRVELNTMHEAKALAVTGLGSPAQFLRSLEPYAKSIAASVTYRDHHAYTDEDWVNIQRLAQSHSVDAVVTSEKDWAKLGPLVQPSGKTKQAEPVPPIYRAALAFRFHLGEAELRAKLDAVCPPR